MCCTICLRHFTDPVSPHFFLGLSPSFFPFDYTDLTCEIISISADYSAQSYIDTYFTSILYSDLNNLYTVCLQSFADSPLLFQTLFSSFLFYYTTYS